MTIDEFFPSISIRIPGVAEPLMADACRRALKTFFQQSSAWLLWSPTVAVSLSEVQVASQLPEAINSIQKVRILDGANLIATSEDTLDNNRPGWRNEKGSVATHYYCDAQNHIYLVPKPETAKTYMAQISLFPTPDSCDIPDWIGQFWVDEIVDGACAYLHAIPGRDYTDQAAAQKYEERLVNAARDAKVKVDRSHVREVRSARLTSFEAL